MSLEPGRVAMMPRNVVVEYLHTKPFLRYFRKSFPPPLISPVTKEMISNRKKVNSGSVVSWGEHGRVAVVQQMDGVKAAFWCHELNEC